MASKNMSKPESVFLLLSFLNCLMFEAKIIILSDVVLNVLEEILKTITL